MANISLVVHPDQVVRLGSFEGIPLREDVCFTDHKGRESRGVRKHAEKILRKLLDPLSKTLEPQETVLYVARAQAPMGTLEQLTLGWYGHYVSATALVVTDRRLLHFLVDRSGKWRQSLRAVRWGDVAEAKVGGWLSRTLELKYQNGEKEKYWAIPRRDGRKLAGLIPQTLQAALGTGSAARGMVSLCPECRAILTPRQYQCPQCGLAFKDEKTALRRSLFIPGGGYFYTGQYFLGFFDFLAEAYLLLLFIVSVVLVFTAGDLPPEPGEEPFTSTDALVFAAIIGGILVVEKLMTIYHCRRFVRDFIPTKDKRPVAPTLAPQ